MYDPPTSNTTLVPAHVDDKKVNIRLYRYMYILNFNFLKARISITILFLYAFHPSLPLRTITTEALSCICISFLSALWVCILISAPNIYYLAFLTVLIFLVFYLLVG